MCIRDRYYISAAKEELAKSRHKYYRALIVFIYLNLMLENNELPLSKPVLASNTSDEDMIAEKGAFLASSSEEDDDKGRCFCM